MKFILNTMTQEVNIAKICINDENLILPIMEITLKSPELAKRYRASLATSLRMNEVSISEGHNTERFNFNVEANDCVVKIEGNIVNALKRMLDDRLISQFTCENMILNNNDEPELEDFLRRNKLFVLPITSDVTDNTHNIQSAQSSQSTNKS